MKTGNDTKMIKRDQNVYSILTANDRKNFLTRLTRSRIFKEVRKEFKWAKNGFLRFGPKRLVYFCLGSMGLGPRIWVWFGTGLTQNVRWADFSSFRWNFGKIRRRNLNFRWRSIFKILENKNFGKNIWITHFWLWFERKFLVFRNLKSFLTFQKCIISHFFRKKWYFRSFSFWNVPIKLRFERCSILNIPEKNLIWKFPSQDSLFNRILQLTWNVSQPNQRQPITSQFYSRVYHHFLH